MHTQDLGEVIGKVEDCIVALGWKARVPGETGRAGNASERSPGNQVQWIQLRVELRQRDSESGLTDFIDRCLIVRNDQLLAMMYAEGGLVYHGRVKTVGQVDYAAVIGKDVIGFQFAPRR